MVYKIDIENLEILNHLLFDASIEFDDLQNLSIDKPIEIEVERRCFENVKRRKFLFWTSTNFTGKTSLIRLSGVADFELDGVDDRFKNNHFINEINFDAQSNVLGLSTAFGLRVKFRVGKDFRGELIDLKDSDFGAGSLFGSKGFTKDEWEEYKNKVT